MKPEDINDRCVQRIVDKLKSKKCVAIGEQVKPEDRIITNFCQTCGQPQFADDGLKCLQCGVDDLTKKRN